MGKPKNAQLPKLDANGKLPESAIVDAEGRQLCYSYVHGKCQDSDCRRYHGPETKAMKEKRLVDEKRMADKRAAAAEAAAAAATKATEGESPEAAKAKKKSRKPKSGKKDEEDK